MIGNTAVFPRMRYSAKPGKPSKSSIRQIKLYSVAVKTAVKPYKEISSHVYTGEGGFGKG